MTDWTKLTGYDPRSGLTLEEHLAEVRHAGHVTAECKVDDRTVVFTRDEIFLERDKGARYQSVSPDDLLRVTSLNPAFADLDWALWEPTDEERTRELVELQKFLTSPPVQAPWTYVTLQVSGGDVTGVHRPPADED